MKDEPEVLLRELRDRGMEGATPVDAIALATETAWVNSLFRLCGGTPPEEWATFDVPPGQVQLVAAVVMREPYFRAVAKIGFHFALKMFPELTGHEREFDRIKDYIWSGSEGGNSGRPVRPMSRQFVEDFDRGRRPRCWMHILAVERSYDRAISFVQLFAGRGGLPFPYLVDLGIDPARIAMPRERRVRLFVMEPVSGDDGVFDGVMEDPGTTNRIIVTPGARLPKTRYG
jgi:hypothetical protein